METTFKLSKDKIIDLLVEGVASFNVDLVTCLSPDYSKEGMGWILQQKICSCQEITPTCCADGWRLVLAGGHFCNPAEQNYSPIEGEATAVAKGLDDTKYYTMGCKRLYVSTDHKNQGEDPLVKVHHRAHPWQAPARGRCTIEDEDQTPCHYLQTWSH